MDDLQAAVCVSFEGPTRADENRAIQELRDELRERAGDGVVATIEKLDKDSQDAGATLVLLFGSSAAVAIAQGIRAYLARRGDAGDRIMIRTADGFELIATGEAARNLDAPALMRSAKRPPTQS
jgi:hypothetical protein